MKRPSGDGEGAQIYGRLLALLENHGREMDEFLVEAQDEVSAAQFSHLKLMIGSVLGHGHMPVHEEVCQKYPALKRGWMK